MVRLRILVVVAALTILVLPVYAHDLEITAYADGMTIQGEAVYPGDGPAVNEKIQVYNMRGDLLHELQTDESGAFTFEATEAIAHRIVCETDDGHRESYTVPAAELSTGMPVVADSAGATQVAEAIRKEITPLRQAIAEQQRQIRLRDVLGGIGYIVGFTGLLMFVKSRRGSQGG